MGLDIGISTDINDKILGETSRNFNVYFNRHSLSRTFCNLMFRQHAISGEAEFDQIGRIISVDISPIYQMEEYGSDEELDGRLQLAETEIEKQQVIHEAQQRKERLVGNIDKVLTTINALIEKLSRVDDLPSLLNASGRDTLNYDIYFTDFNIDKGEGYIGNNFGQDLRNFRRFLEFAKERGATTVYFNYG